MSMNEYLELRKQCEDWMREGRGRKVAHALAHINLPRIARTARLPLANLARRVNLPTLGLKILSPVIVSKDKGFIATAGQQELAEYAALLHKIGSSREGLRVLNRLSAQDSNEALLYKAFSYIGLWEYR